MKARKKKEKMWKEEEKIGNDENDDEDEREFISEYLYSLRKKNEDQE